MHQRFQVRGKKVKAGRFRPSFACGLRSVDLGVRRGSMALILVGVLTLAGCDLFDPAKTDDPVFGPPPPRKLAAGNRAPAGPSTLQTADNSPATPGASPSSTTAGGATSGNTTFGNTTSGNTATGNTTSGSAASASTAAGSAAESDGSLQTASASASATARGAAPSDETIKRTSFTGHVPPPAQKLSGNEVAAMVNGQPIFTSEIFERAFPEPLPPEGLSLLVAYRAFAAHRLSEPEVRTLQEAAIRKYLKDYIKTRLLAQTIEFKLEKEQKEKIEEAIGKMFDEYVEKLKKDLKVAARHEVEKKLKEQGTSLAGLKIEFRYRLLADECLRQKSKKPHVVGREEVLAYYEAHLADYSYPEKVHWQLLEISFAKHGGETKSLAVLEQAVDALRRGESFAKVAKKYSDGPRAEEGGQQSWTKPDSVADEKTAGMLHKLAVGEVSPVVHTAESFRLIRLNARKPAGRNSLAEVQEAIRRKIEDRLQKEATRDALVEIYRHSAIESAFLSPEELGPPAEFAVPSASSRNGNQSTKKHRDRS